MKNRPRIPTPDVTKEVVDRENRIALGSIQNQSGVTLLPQQLQAYQSFATGDAPVVQVVLSPIQELDGSGSVNNTLHANQPGTAALAQAVLSPTLGPVITTPVSVPMTVTQLTSLGFSSVHNSPLLTRSTIHPSSSTPTFIQAFAPMETTPPPLPSTAPPPKLTLTEVMLDDDDVQISSRSSNNSDVSKESMASNATNTTISMMSKKSLEIGDGDANKLETIITSNTSEPIITSSASAPNSLPSLGNGGSEDLSGRARKVSAVSQGSGPPKRGEVYV